MKRAIYSEDGRTLLWHDEAEPVCGNDFCDECGDCLACYGEYCQPCRWIVYGEPDPEEDDGE